MPRHFDFQHFSALCPAESLHPIPTCLCVWCPRIPIYMELKFDVGVNIAIGLIQFPPMSALFDKSPVSRLSSWSSSALEAGKGSMPASHVCDVCRSCGYESRHHSSFLHLFGKQLFQFEISWRAKTFPYVEDKLKREWLSQEMWHVHRWHVWTLGQQVGPSALSRHLWRTGPATFGCCCKSHGLMN